MVTIKECGLDMYLYGKGTMLTEKQITLLEKFAPERDFLAQHFEA